jgi:tRNA-dihydrouridine synthase
MCRKHTKHFDVHYAMCIESLKSQTDLKKIRKSFCKVFNSNPIFALGDITDLQEAKQFQKTAGHVSVVVPNILSYLDEEGR